MICCPLYNDSDERASAQSRLTPRARREHHCCECGEVISVGQQYEKYGLVYDRSAETFKTCLSCVEIRDHFACGNGWIFGEVWSQLEGNFFPEMKAGGPCMEGLSPAAKARLFERRLKWYEERHS